MRIDMHDDERTQRERADGAWEIHIDDRPADDNWRPLRRALRLSRADLPWLKQRVPGVVRRGAEVDLAPVVTRILEVGVRARLLRRAARAGAVEDMEDTKGDA